MFSSLRTATLITLFFLLTMLAGFLITRTATPPSSQKNQTAGNKAQPHRFLLPENKSPRRPRQNTKRPVKEDLPPMALANERIFRFKNDADYQKFLASLKARGLKRLGQSDHFRAVRVGLSLGADLSDIDGSEMGYNYTVTIPNPPQASAQASATGFGMNALSWLGVTGDNSSWGKGITVAVLDSGVNEHIALQGNVTQIALTELAAGSTQLGHGTAVASIISGDHPLTPGIAPASDILSIRVSDETGNSNSFTLAEGIIQAVDAGANIINISMGSYGDSSVVSDAVLYAQGQGAIIVASSGNEGLESMAYPAAYDGVISVGAVEEGGEHLDFSNSGDTLSITAPGYEVNAAWGSEELTAFSGTSASAPFISGAIAATLTAHPNLTTQQAADLVMELSNDAGYPGTDPDYGTGTLDMGRIIDYGTTGIYDAAVSGQILVSPESAVTLPEVWVTIQNQGTETLINSPVVVTTPSGTKKLNISSLTPGQIQTFRIPVVLPYNGDEVMISSSVQSTEVDKDNTNNSRTTIFAREISPASE